MQRDDIEAKSAVHPRIPLAGLRAFWLAYVRTWKGTKLSRHGYRPSRMRWPSAYAEAWLAGQIHSHGRGCSRLRRQPIRRSGIRLWRRYLRNLGGPDRHDTPLSFWGGSEVRSQPTAPL